MKVNGTAAPNDVFVRMAKAKKPTATALNALGDMYKEFLSTIEANALKQLEQMLSIYFDELSHEYSVPLRISVVCTPNIQ